MRVCPDCGKQYPDEQIKCSVDGAVLNQADRIPRAAVDRVLHRELKPGDVIGAYNVLEVRGEKGVGRIYLAEHVKLGRRVELNVLHGRHAKNSTAVAKFFREAQAVNRVDHDNILQITDMCEDVDGVSFSVVEAFKGESLKELLDRTGAISPMRAVKIGAVVADALAATHDAGIVHCDLRPDSILVRNTDSGEDIVKVTDFGAALLADPRGDGTSGSSDIGDTRFMAPEQFRGGEVDRRADIYSLGLVLYTAMTARPPFEGESYAALAHQHMTQKPGRLGELPALAGKIPAALDRLIGDCLQKRIDQRPRSMAEVALQLRQIVELMRSGASEVVARRMRQPRPVVALAVAAVIGLVVGGTGVGLLTGGGEPGAAGGGAATSDAAVAGGGDVMDASALAAASSLEAGAKAEAPVGARQDAAAVDAEVRAPADDLIELSFTSLPSGALVYQAGVRRPLGKTPLVISASRAETVQTFEVKARGHRPQRVKISLTSSGESHVELEPKSKRARRARRAALLKSGRDRAPQGQGATAAPAAPAGSKPRGTNSETINPFAVE